MYLPVAVTERRSFKPIAIGNIAGLQSLLIRCSLVNLFIVALIGVLLRSFSFLPSFSLEYKNILHGHSHFAFGGWVMPAILGLLLKNFPALEKNIAYKHWRAITFLLLFSAYGMLITFPLQGYKTFSIFFSTLSILSGFYLVFVIWKASLANSVATKFLKAGSIYMVFSSLGPLATGPMIAMGRSGTPIYFDVIYFYLHFQYNGWFVFALLAFIYQYLETREIKTNGQKVFWLLNISCVPTYFLSVLWHQPSMLFNFIGGAGAFLQCIAAGYLFIDMLQLKFRNKLVAALLKLSIISLAVKIVLQFFSAFPSMALLAYHQRNFVIAYLHLVLLGCISLFLIAWIFRSYAITATRGLKVGAFLFITAFVCSELLLVASPLIGATLPHYSLLLLGFSILLPIGIALFIWELWRRTLSYTCITVD